jgi:hypothetical protein
VTTEPGEQHQEGKAGAEDSKPEQGIVAEGRWCDPYQPDELA